MTFQKRVKQPAYVTLDIPRKIADLLSSDKRFLCAYGGRSAARSWSFGAYCLAAGQRQPLKIACMRETMESIRDSSHSILQGWIDRIPQFGAHYRVEQARILGKNGTEIIFKGLKEEGAHGIKSLEGVDICWVDEAHAVSHRSWDMLIPTIRKPGSRFLIGWNPDSEDDPVWEQVIVKRSPMVEAVQCNYLDNPFCPPEVVAEAENMRLADPERYEHIWLGKPRGTASTQVIGRELITQSLGCTPLLTDELPVLAVDPARYGDDPTGFLVRKGNDLTLVEERYNLSGPQTMELTLDLAVRHGVGAIVVDVAGLGGPIYDFLDQRKPCKLVAFNGGFATSKRPDYANLRAEAWFQARDWLKTGRIPNSDVLIAQLTCQHYRHTTSGQIILVSKEEMRRAGIKSPNVADCLGMSLSVHIKATDGPKVRKPVSRAGRSWGWS